MKRSVLLAVSLLLLAPSLDATSMQCLPSRGCPKDQKPPACCKAPPCEFFHELKVAQAMRHAVSIEVQRFALALAEDDADAGHAVYGRALRADMLKAHKRFAKCPASYFYRQPPAVMAMATQQCRIMGDIGGGLTEISLDDMKANSNSCDEVVEAEYANASMQQIHCQADAQKTLARTVQERRWQDLTEAQSQIDSLEASLLRYWGACSVVADAETARRVADAGLKALENAPTPGKSGDKTAKRTAKRA